MQICRGESQDNVWPQYLLMISRLRSGSRCSDKKFLINITETADNNTSHHVSPSRPLSGPRSLLGSGWPLPLQPLPSFLSLHWFLGWVVSRMFVCIIILVLYLGCVFADPYDKYERYSLALNRCRQIFGPRGRLVEVYSLEDQQAILPIMQVKLHIL